MQTYTLVVLLHMSAAGVQLPVWLWLLDWAAGLTPRLSDFLSSRGLHWLELFYTQHRMAHLPKAMLIKITHRCPWLQITLQRDIIFYP